MRKIIIVVLCIGILVSWQIFQSDLANAWGKHKRCSIAGAWRITGVGDDPTEGFMIFTPLDAWGKRFSVTGDGTLYFDPTFKGVFPADTKAGMPFGYAEKTGHRTYDLSIYQYGISQAPVTEGWGTGKVWKIVQRFVVEMVDCDHARDAGVFRLFWFDGENWNPAPICHEAQTIYERITHEPACGPLPPLPD